MSKWNGNKFSVYESEEKTVLGLLDELGSQVNHNTDNFKNKTDLYGDHKGSWQGLSKPTLSDEGMRATVEMLLKSVDKSIIIISDLPNYDKNDISIVLNSLVFEEGKTYVLNDGTVKSKDKISVTLPNRCNLYLLSEILCENDFISISCPTSNNKGNDVIISYVEYVGVPSIKDSKIGVEIRKGANVNYTIGVVRNFGYGLYLCCENGEDWIQYCNFKFKEIIATQVGISIIVNHTYNWINENNFYGGGLSGINNIVMEQRGGEGSLINSNRFHDIGVYTNGTEIIYIANDGVQGNAFYDLRLWEQTWDTSKHFIYDLGENNYFSSKYKAPFDLIILGKNSTYEGGLYSKEVNPHTQKYELITNKMTKNENGQYLLEKFNEYNEGVTVDGVRKIYKYVDTILCGLAENETLTLEIQPCLTRKGVSFFVRKNASFNSTLHIKLPQGRKVTISNENGLYKCNMISDDWCEVYKIGDGDGLQPS